MKKTITVIICFLAMLVATSASCATISVAGTVVQNIGMGRQIDPSINAATGVVTCTASVAFTKSGIFPAASPVTGTVSVKFGDEEKYFSPGQSYSWQLTFFDKKLFYFTTYSVSNASGEDQSGQTMYSLKCGNSTQTSSVPFSVKGSSASATIPDTIDISGALNTTITQSFSLTALSGNPVFTLTPGIISGGYGSLCNTENKCSTYIINGWSSRPPYTLSSGTHTIQWTPTDAGKYTGKINVVMSIP